MPHGSSQFPLLTSAQRTAATDSAYIPNREAHKGVRVFLNVSNIHGVTPGLTLSIQVRDDASGNYVTLLTGAAVTTVSTNAYEVYPQGGTAANALANAHIGKGFRIRIAVADADAATYSVYGEWLP